MILLLGWETKQTTILLTNNKERAAEKPVVEKHNHPFVISYELYVHCNIEQEKNFTISNEQQKSRMKAIDVENTIVHFWLAINYNFMLRIVLKNSLLLHYPL